MVRRIARVTFLRCAAVAMPFCGTSTGASGDLFNERDVQVLAIATRIPSKDRRSEAGLRQGVNMSVLVEGRQIMEERAARLVEEARQEAAARPILRSVT